MEVENRDSMEGPGAGSESILITTTTTTIDDDDDDDDDIDHHIPMDMVLGILLWLPVSSLLRLKRVSTSWLSLIESPDFVYTHLHFNSSPLAETEEDHHDAGTKLILLSSPDEFHNQRLSLISLQFDNTPSCGALLLDFPTIHDPYRFLPVELIGSCNGIICLRQGQAVCFWNPATKQSLHLPPIPVSSSRSYPGFGFDVNSNDYKLVYLFDNCGPTAHIYTLASDHWKTIHDPFLRHIDFHHNEKALYHNGFSHWIVSYRDGNDDLNIILSFDNHHDRFLTTATFPNILRLPKTLFVLQGNIACIYKFGNFRFGDPQTCHSEIWMLNDGEWTKLYMIEPFSIDFYWMTWASNNADFLLLLDSTQLCLCNIVSQEIMKLPIHVSYGFEAVVYRESLVSVKRGKTAPICDSYSSPKEEMLINESMAGHSCCTNNIIPEAVVFRILLLLPVASLLRFKRVCVSWYHVIESSDFVAQHLFYHHHQYDSNNINFILHCGDPRAPFVDSLHPSQHISCTCLLSADKFKVLDLPCFNSWWYYSPRVRTSFDGIICLTHDFDVYLWNPATKQFRVVLSLEYSGEFHFGERRQLENFHFGFGYDVRTKDYKLVRFLKELYDDPVPSVVQVYNLSTDSWRTITDEILLTVEDIECCGRGVPYRNESYCWLAGVRHSPYSLTILSFDFSDEVFRTIPLPNSINKILFTHELAILRENIVCISIDTSEKSGNWCRDIWMMNEFGIKESWTKLYTVGPFSQDWHVQAYYSNKNGDYMLLLKDGILYAYDLVFQEIEKLPVQVQGPERCWVVIYKESLVPIRSC